MNRTKRTIVAVASIFGALLVLAFFLNNVAPSPVAAAKASCIERGWVESQLELRRFQTSAKITGSAGSVDFTVGSNNESKVVRVTLKKPLYSLRWKVVTCEEVQD